MVEVKDSDDVSFVPERVSRSIQEVGLGSGAASIAREYATCPDCGASLAENIGFGKEADRDVHFSLFCPECDAHLSIMVEEKVWGVVGDLDHPYLANSMDVFEIGDGLYFLIDPAQIFVRHR